MRARRAWGPSVRPLYALTSLRGVEQAIAGLDQLMEQMPRALVAAVRVCTEEAATRARALAPRSTGALVAAISTTYFDDGETGAVFVAPVKENWQRMSMGRQAGFEKRARARGVARATTRAKNYPRWIEFGTRRMDAKPFLLPASAQAYSRLVSTAEEMIGRLVKQAEV